MVKNAKNVRVAKRMLKKPKPVEQPPPDEDEDEDGDRDEDEERVSSPTPSGSSRSSPASSQSRDSTKRVCKLSEENLLRLGAVRDTVDFG